jgi:ATP-dependent Clp protease ATP-binding subunit ClpC
VADWKGIPVEQLSPDTRERLRNLAKELRRRIKGQDEVVDAVTQAVQVAYLGLSSPKKPHGVFLFAGPTGVGKTELAKALAEQLFGDETNLLRFDMSEYMEPHSVSRLVGSPPGYIGHEEGAQLVDAVRQRPFSIVLFDEMEKAHPQVANLFLQVFDDGRLTDTKGRTADFRNTIIIMTSNLGAAVMMDDGRGTFGFQASKSEPADPLSAYILESIRMHFAPEFLGRLTGIHIFRPLDKVTSRQIIEKYIDLLKEQLKSHQVRLEVADGVYDLLLETGFSTELGARPLERVIDRLLRAPVAQALLQKPSSARQRTLTVTREGESLQFRWKKPAGGKP